MSEGARASWSKRGCGDSHRRGEAAGILAARLKLVDKKQTSELHSALIGIVTVYVP